MPNDRTKHIPNLIDLLIYRSIKKSDDERDHATLKEIGEDVGIVHTGNVAYRVEKLMESGLIYKRQGTTYRGIRINRDEEADIRILNDGDMDMEVSDHLLYELGGRSGMLIFVSDECLDEARKTLDKN